MQAVTYAERGLGGGTDPLLCKDKKPLKGVQGEWFLLAIYDAFSAIVVFEKRSVPRQKNSCGRHCIQADTRECQML